MSVILSEGATNYLMWLERRQKGKRGKALKVRCRACGGTWEEYVLGQDYPPCPACCSKDVGPKEV